jgi:hypothetical protein
MPLMNGKQYNREFKKRKSLKIYMNSEFIEKRQPNFTGK